MIEINALCVRCLVDKHTETAYSLDPVKATAFCADMLELVRSGTGCNNSSVIGARINSLYSKHFGLGQDRFIAEKEQSNTFVLKRLDRIRQMVQQQDDPVLAALRFAVLGNYLDFSALQGQVSFEKLDQMLVDALSMELDMQVYGQLLCDLQKAGNLLYVTDNAGEIGFDRILAEQLQAHFPQLQITFCVRGLPAHNDATRQDASVMGITFPIVDTGNDVGGMALEELGSEAKAAVAKSDLILSKGMGNVETLYGSGLPVYYAFLIKCPRFVEVFQKPMLTPMLLKEQTD